VSVALTNVFWDLRMNGEDPANLPGTSDSFTLTGSSGDGSASNGVWVIDGSGTGQKWSYVPATGDAYTMVACISYGATDPDNGEVLMALDNGTNRVEVQATGNIQTLKLVGTTTVQTEYLDIKMLNDDPVPVILRLTLDASGNGRLYMREIIEDDDAETHYISVTGSASTTKQILWGNNSGVVNWNNVYATKDGAYSPDEMAPSDFVTDTLLRLGLSIVERLKASTRMYLKTHVDDSSIVYGYDISSQMVSRLRPPAIHVILQNVNSPNFTSLGGTRIEQMYDVILFITTRGTNYENAYRMGMDITGEVFDELYTTTGLKGTTDSLVSYNVALDTKRDNDEVVCSHVLTLTYMRRLNMNHR